MNEIVFVGAGPGDPELITVKGQKQVKQADLIVYAGSLVPIAVIDARKPTCVIENSAKMTLDEVIESMSMAWKAGKKVVRLHTGDPSIYGAIREQMDALDALEIPYRVIPGVSSFVASAAALKKEYTLPGVSQTVICTRMEGRTPVPEKEALSKLASHQASMAIFLSVHMIEDVVDQLRVHYPINTPVAVVQRASWPDEIKVVGTLETIAKRVQKAKITKTAQILVGSFLDGPYELSKLYDGSFSHEYREAK